jgi:protein involved in sex pheromone biosynthesis
MAKQGIPVEIKQQVDEIVERFNDEIIQDAHRFFETRYRGLYVYLDRRDGHIVSQRGRIKYTGAMDEWEFAIFKYSSETYDPDEWMFPGSQYLNGTVEGALKACAAAYS